jgi:hypothetical protein
LKTSVPASNRLRCGFTVCRETEPKDSSYGTDF